MKKSLIALVLLTALSLGGLGYAAAAISGSGSKVEITPFDLVGDPHMLDGLKVELRSSSMEKLCWDTDYSPNGQPETRFHYGEQDHYREQESCLYYDSTGFNYSCHGHITELDPEGAPRDRIFAHVAAHTGAGEEHTEYALVSDFFDFYPFYVDLDLRWPDGQGGFRDTHLHYDALDGSSDMDGMDLTAEGEPKPHFLFQFMDAFRFPVDPNEKLKLTAYRNEKGVYEELSCESLKSPPGIHTYSADAGDWLYFIMEYDSQNPFGPEVYAHTPGGYGLYRFPLKNPALLTIEDVELVLPLDLSVRIGTLAATEDRGQVLLSSLDDGTPALRVLDARTGALLQQLEPELVDDHDHEDYFSTPGLWPCDGFATMSWYNDRILLEQLPDGSWRPRFHIPPADVGTIPSLQRWRDRDMAFDGQRLACIYTGSRSDENKYPGNSFTILVYDESGLAYGGYFYNGLDAGSDEDLGWHQIVKCNPRGPHYIHWEA